MNVAAAISTRKRAFAALLPALAVGLLLAGGQAWATSATAPLQLKVQTIGKGIVTGTGIKCGSGYVACTGEYTAGTASVDLTAAPATGWTFVGWQDDASGCAAANPCTQPLSGDDTATAVFSTSGAVGSATLNVATTDNGTVTNKGTAALTSGTTIDCTTDTPAPADYSCSQTVVAGSTLTVEAAADAGYLFARWGGSCTGNAPTCSVYLPATRSISADFVTTSTSKLTVNVNGSGTVSGSGVNCSNGSTCTYQEAASSTVTVSAAPGPGYAFTGWDTSSDCSGTQPTCSLQMDVDRVATANFAKVVPVLLTVNGLGTVSGAGMTCGPGPQTCSGSAAPGSTIQFQASPSTTGGTISWTGCTSAAGPICNVVVGTSPISVQATFAGGTTGGGSSFALHLDVSGDGYVTATRGATIYCTAAGGSGCDASIPQNTAVTLTAIPASGSAVDFNSWLTGPCAGSTSTTCNFTMTGAKSGSADFNGDDLTYDLTGAVSGNGSITGGGLQCRLTGTASCTGPQAAAAHITLTALPGAGSSFLGWSGGCTGTSQTCTVVMSSDQNVTASFSQPAALNDDLTISITGAGQVDASGGRCLSTVKKPGACTQRYSPGTAVTLKAVPAAGYVFTGWSGDCAGKKATCALTMSSSHQVAATFVRAPIAIGKKATVAKVATGYRVTLHFVAGTAGRLTVVGKRSGTKPVTAAKTVKAGAGSIRLTVKTRGTYAFTLTLHVKGKAYAIRVRVKV